MSDMTFGEFKKWLALCGVSGGSTGAIINASWNSAGGGAGGATFGNIINVDAGKESASPIYYFGPFSPAGTDFSGLSAELVMLGAIPLQATLNKIINTAADLSIMSFSGPNDGVSGFSLWTASDNEGNDNYAGAYNFLPIVNYGSGPGRLKVTGAGSHTLDVTQAWVNITGTAIAVTLILPDEGTILDGHEVQVSIQAAITSITLTSPNSKTISTGTIPVVARTYFTVHYDAQDSTWYRRA